MTTIEALTAGVVLLALAGCTDADVASHNISKAADQFEVDRRITFVNGITGQFLLVINGKCSLGNNDRNRELSVTCKIGPNAYRKHFLGLADNVTYVVEQTDPAPADTYQYRFVLRPSAIIPNIEVH